MNTKVNGLWHCLMNLKVTFLKYVKPVFHTNLKYHKFLHKDDPWQGVSNHKRMSQCEIWPYCETPPVSHFRSEK